MKSIEEISKATGAPIEFVCEAVEENKLDDLLKTLEYHKAEAAKIQEVVEKFINDNKELENVDAEPESEEQVLADCGVTPETCPEIYGKTSQYIFDNNKVEADFGKENLEAGKKLLDDILGEE